jgi:hypothetical protein
LFVKPIRGGLCGVHHRHERRQVVGALPDSQGNDDLVGGDGELSVVACTNPWRVGISREAGSVVFATGFVVFVVSVVGCSSRVGSSASAASTARRLLPEVRG